VDAFSDDGVCVLKWKDRRDVLMISSEFGSNMLNVPHRRRAGDVSLPEAVVHYNRLMGGIDHLDQMMAYYPIQRKCLKWYRDLGIHILHLILVNSYFLRLKTSKISLYDFQLSVIRSLLHSALSVNPKPPSKPKLPTHFPIFNTTPNKKRKIHKRCRLCLTKKSGRRLPSSVPSAKSLLLPVLNASSPFTRICKFIKIFVNTIFMKPCQLEKYL
jgi:hypothetical protein